MAFYRTALREDIPELARTMREQDRVEIWHSHGLAPLEALEFSFDLAVENNSIISDEGKVIGMFGVGEVAPNIGIPWLLGSDELPKIAREFIPESRKWIERVHERHDLLYNYVYAENSVSIRWLKWLGFSFIRRIDDWGANPAPFYEFVKLRGN